MQFKRSTNVPFYSNYAKYRPHLRTDFLKRCSYCERPEFAVGGEAHCEIDHRRPITLFSELRSDYNNLYYSCRDCNGAKSEKWPRPEDEIRGRRFADPCLEDFYLDHATEDLAGTLSWKSECGRFTIDAIRLNRKILTDWRAERASMRERISKLVGFQALLRESLEDQETNTRELLAQISTEVGELVAIAERIYGL